jgi:hypothetical protein
MSDPLIDPYQNSVNNGTDDHIQPLPGDNGTPFSPPDDPAAGSIDDTHPATDSASNIDAHQLYDEGLSGATGTSEPRTTENPDQDTRPQ